MASIYKERGKWTASWFDSTGKRRTARGIASRQLATQIGERNEFRRQAAAHGVIEPSQERYAREAERDLEQHLADFRTAMKAKKNTPKYIDGTIGGIKRIFKAAGITRIDQIDRFRVVKALDSIPPERSVKGGKISYARRNRLMAACKVFAGWLAHEVSRIAVNPLARMKALDEQQDRRRIRVALGRDEVIKLIETTATQKVRGGMTGIDRMVRYALGIGTGFRQGTLFGLTPESFHLGSRPAFIRVVATNTKNRKAKDHPISMELAEMVRPWLKGKKAGQPVFSHSKGAKPIIAYRGDLKAAGIEYQLDDDLFCDLHAQRNAFITEVIRVAGLKVAQDLAGHSTPALTSKYGRLGMDDYTGAVEKLPSMKRDAKSGKDRKQIG